MAWNCNDWQWLGTAGADIPPCATCALVKFIRFFFRGSSSDLTQLESIIEFASLYRKVGLFLSIVGLLLSSCVLSMLGFGSFVACGFFKMASLYNVRSWIVYVLWFFTNAFVFVDFLKSISFLAMRSVYLLSKVVFKPWGHLLLWCRCPIPSLTEPSRDRLFSDC